MLSRRWDSNPLPAVYDTAALPAELLRHYRLSCLEYNFSMTDVRELCRFVRENEFFVTREGLLESQYRALLEDGSLTLVLCEHGGFNSPMIAVNLTDVYSIPSIYLRGGLNGLRNDEIRRHQYYQEINATKNVITVLTELAQLRVGEALSHLKVSHLFADESSVYDHFDRLRAVKQL